MEGVSSSSCVARQKDEGKMKCTQIAVIGRQRRTIIFIFDTTVAPGKQSGLRLRAQESARCVLLGNKDRFAL